MNNIEQIKTDKFSFYVFRNIFNDDELELIWKEALFLCEQDKLKDTSTAYFEDGRSKKNNKGMWLSSLYNVENISNYLKIYKKPLQNLYQYNVNDYTLNLFCNTNKDETLISYYENDNYYSPHFDISAYTYIFWLFKEPKNFFGGDLTFDDVNYKLQVNSNMAVLFPSWAIHSVDKVTMLPGVKTYKGFGRFAFTTFYTFG